MTRPATRRCGAYPKCSTVGSSRARCRSRRRITPSRTRSGSTSTPLTSSWSTSRSRAAGSTRCTCCRSRCSIGLRSRTASATVWSSTKTAASCRSDCATTPIPKSSSRPSGPTRCVGSSWHRRSCAAATCASTARVRASVTRCAWSSTPSGTRTRSSPCTRTSTPIARSSAPTRHSCSIGTCWRRHASLSTPSPRAWTPTTSRARAPTSPCTSTR